MEKKYLITLLILSHLIYAQQLIPETQVLEIQDGWDEFMTITEAEVTKGSISRSDANNLYSDTEINMVGETIGKRVMMKSYKSISKS
jgi:hypothetical protein